jgi:hypothetical protein
LKVILLDKQLVQDTIYKKAYRTHKLNEVSKVLLGHGKYKDLSGKEFLSLPIEQQIEYSLRDSELVMELSKHNNFEVLDAMLAISEIAELDFELVCRTSLSRWWSAIFDKMVKDKECQSRAATRYSFSGTYDGGLEPFAVAFLPNNFCLISFRSWLCISECWDAASSC